MSTLKLQHLFGIILATLCIIAAPPQSHAATKAKSKAIQPAKERLVLMPLRLGEEDQNLQGAMEMALVKGLQQKYEVFFGEQVAKKAREIFMKESRNTTKKECDETRCLQGIAEAFQAELLATANITKKSDGYFIALSVQNLFDNKVVQSESVPCKGCDAYAVIEKLKELVGTPAPVAAAPIAEPPTPKITATDPDSITWAEAQKGNTADDYQVYLDAYPKGKYIAFAKAKLKKLKEAEQAATEQQEQKAWDTAQQENSEASYSLYIKGYPNGRFVGFAKVRMDKLKNDVAAREEASQWKRADTSNDKAAVENYLSKYPTGRYISAANAKLKFMQTSGEANQHAKVEDDLWNKADNSNSRGIIEIYLNRYPAGKYAANAKAKLKAFNEENGIPKAEAQLTTSKQNESHLNGDGASPDASVNLNAVPDAVPKAEPLHRYANREYRALGETYKPLTVTGSYIETGIASWYGKKFHGQSTSTGETYDMYGMTAAHTTLPVPSYARVTNVVTKKSVIVRINDRGPFLKDRIIDLSYAAAYKLGVINLESANVLVESIAAE